MSHRQMRSFLQAYVSTALAGVAMLLFAAQPASAQTGQNGTTGGTGIPGLGTTGTGTTGTGTTTGGTNNGTGGTGGGGGVQVGQAPTNALAPTFMEFGTAVDTTGGTGFVGRGNTTQNFIGGALQQGQGQNPFGGQGRNQFSALNRQGQQNRQAPQSGPSRSELVRPRYRIAFDYPQSNTTEVLTRLQGRLTSIPSRISGVQVTLDEEGTAILSGTTATEQESKLAAAMARIEPGVRKVDNQLTVGGGN